MKLFVYGTLAPGKPNEHLLKNLNGVWTPGIVKGKLFSSGWGAALGFPGIVLDPLGEDIKGLVFTSSALEENWTMLDEFEGEGYDRVLTTVLLETGELVESYIYALSSTKAE